MRAPAPAVARRTRRLVLPGLAALAALGLGVGPAAALTLPAPGTGLVAPLNIAPPSIAGAARAGAPFTCSAGSWLLSPTAYAYSWYRDSATKLVGVTGTVGSSSAYTPTSADVGHAITCGVVASNPAGSSASAVSAPVYPLPSLPVVPVDVTPPVISGTATPGGALSCSPGSWLPTPDRYLYTWMRDGSTTVAGPSATPTYAPVDADVGHGISCGVVAYDSAGPGNLATSSPVSVLSVPGPAIPVNTSPPSLAGTPQSGQTLTCSPGAWLPAPVSYTYAWVLNGATTIAGNAGPAATSTLALADNEVGQQISCAVVALDAAGIGIRAVSAPVTVTAAPSVPVVVQPPAIYGTAQVGQLVHCSPGTWNPATDAYAFAWSLDGTPIAGAESEALLLTAGQAGHSLTCTVVAADAAGPSTPAISAPVLPAAAPAPPSGSAPSGGVTPGSPGSSVAASRLVVSEFAANPAKMVLRKRGRGLTTAGLTFGFRLSGPGAVLVGLTAIRPGARSKGRCVPVPAAANPSARKAPIEPTARAADTALAARKNPGRAKTQTKAKAKAKAPACTLQLPLTLIPDLAGRPGLNRLPFNGLVRGKPLPVGSYVATILAANGYGWSVARSTGFTVALAGKAAPPRHVVKPKRPHKKPSHRKPRHHRAARH